MQIKVIRRWFAEDSTISKILVDGKFFAYGLEDQVRPQKQGKVVDKVYSETAIPYGTYPVSIRYWDKVGRDVPQINNVPGFAGILIHPGTTSKDTAGCLLVGYKKTTYNGEPAILDSKKAADDLTKKIQQELKLGGKVDIKFVNYEKRVIIGISIAVGIILAVYFLKKYF